MLFTHIHTEEIGTNIFFEKRVLFENAPRSAPDGNASALTTKEIKTLKGKEKITIAKEQKELRSVLLLKMMTAEVTQELIDAEEKYEEGLRELKDKKKEYLRELDGKTFKMSRLDKASFYNLLKEIKEGENLVSTPSIGSPDYMKELWRSNMKKNDIRNDIITNKAHSLGEITSDESENEYQEYDKKYNNSVKSLKQALKSQQKDIINRLFEEMRKNQIKFDSKEFSYDELETLLREEVNDYVKELHTLEGRKKNVENSIESLETTHKSISALIEYLVTELAKKGDNTEEGGKTESEISEAESLLQEHEEDLEEYKYELEKTEQQITALKSKYGRD